MFGELGELLFLPIRVVVGWSFCRCDTCVFMCRVSCVCVFCEKKVNWQLKRFRCFKIGLTYS